MRHEAFDDLTRRLAGRSLSRRALLQSLGLTAVAAGESTRTAFAQNATPTAAPATDDPFAFDAIAFNLEYDLRAIFDVVAKRIGYDPYAGALRGAKGTIAGLAGNSVDQALLLAALLGESMATVRFVTGTLTAEAKASLLASLALSTAETKARAAVQKVASGSDFTPDPPATDAPPFQTDDPALQPFVAALAARDALVKRQVAAAIATFTGALSEAGITLPAPVVALPMEEIERHTWLQIASGPNWVDLDPSIPNAEIGKAYATEPAVIAAIPDELYHLVRFRVDADVASGTGFETKELLTHEMRAADLVGLPLAFVHPQPGAFQGTGLAVVEAIAGTVAYYPTLAVGDDVIADQPITVGNGNGAIDVLGASTIEGETLAERMTVEIVMPGRDPVGVTRTVFDRIPAEQRASGTLDPASIPPVAMVDVPGAGAVFAPMIDLVTFGVAGSTVPATRVLPGPRRADTLAHVGSMSDVYHLTRDDLLSGLALAHGYRYFADGPSIVAHVNSLTDPSSPDSAVSVAADVWHRQLAAVPLTDGASSVHPGIVQAVYAHSAERVQLDPSWYGALSPSSSEQPSPGVSVGAMFEAAAAQSIATKVIAPGANAFAMSGLGLSSAAKALVDDALHGGSIVILPERDVPLDGTPVRGWWLVNPATGYVVDQLANGRSTELIEYAQQVAEFVYGALPKFRTIGCAIAFAGIVGAWTIAIGSTIQLVEAHRAGGAVLGTFVVMEGSHATAVVSLLAPLAGCA
jgi:hypothetical protein